MSRRFALTLVTTLLFLIVCSVYFLHFYYQKNDTDVVSASKIGFHSASYSRAQFYDGIENDGYVDKISEKIRGGIVSHHLLAKADIANFFAEFRSQPIDTVVLVGPNHFSIGDAPVISSETGFSTPYGDILVNKEVIQPLVDQKDIAINELPFDHEHSVGALTPYIAYNFPEAKIVPILLRRNVSQQQVDDLLDSLKSFLPSDSIIISSVDFSHHLNRMSTEFHDVMSVSAIENFDYDRIFRSEIDSPPSIYLLLKYLDSVGARNIQYKNTNSTKFTGNLGTEDATSYLFAHFTDGGGEDIETSATSLHFGDMMFGREIKSMIEQGQDPFEYIKGTEGNFMRGVDVIFGNLEGVVSTSTNCRTDKEVILKFEPSVGELLSQYNFSGVNLANNHSYDCLETGLTDTQRILENNDLFHLGSELQDGYKVVEVGSESIALVGINEVTRWEDNIQETLSKITQLSKDHDSVVVHVHWGREYDSVPTEEQRILAHELIDAGAQVIIGHQPHVVQNIESYKGKIIFYSLGNFIFDQTQPGTTEGFAVGLIHKQGVTRGLIFPYEMVDMKPKLLPYEAAVEYCEDVLSEVDRLEECGFNLEN